MAQSATIEILCTLKLEKVYHKGKILVEPFPQDIMKEIEAGAGTLKYTPAPASVENEINPIKEEEQEALSIKTQENEIPVVPDPREEEKTPVRRSRKVS